MEFERNRLAKDQREEYSRKVVDGGNPKGKALAGN